MTPPGSRAGLPAVPAAVVIRPMQPADASDVLAIYQAGLDTGDASFETTAPSWEAFDHAKLAPHRHVATGVSGQVLGWVAASAVSGRCVYRGVIEHSVYVHPAARGHRIGAALLGALIGSADADGIWTIQTGIFPENTASLRLHQRAGFRIVGTRERIGCHRGHWRDVTLLERRSTSTGPVNAPYRCAGAPASAEGSQERQGLRPRPLRKVVRRDTERMRSGARTHLEIFNG